MNILLYQDRGTAPNSVRQTYQSLKSLVGHAYDIIHVDARALRSDPWESYCAMLVMPGGRDLPYCEDLQGEPNARIRRFVENGGRYLGICAGAYYGSAAVEFEKHDPVMQVCGSRELAFYPGVSRGTTYPGFVYNSERGARSVSILVNSTLLDPYAANTTTTTTTTSSSPFKQSIRMYYNGGGYFAHSDRFDGKVEVIARFEDPGACSDESNPAAAVHCRIGQGHAVLIATHPEYNAGPGDLNNADATDSMKCIIKDLIRSEMDRKLFLRGVFDRMGLQVVPFGFGANGSHDLKENRVPDLTPLYLAMHESAVSPSPISTFAKLLDQWTEAVNPVSKVLECVHDAFYLSALDEYQDTTIPTNQTALNLLSLERQQQGKPAIIKLFYKTSAIYNGNMHDRQRIIPPPHLTPYICLDNYFDSLNYWRKQHRKEWAHFGNTMLYSQVMESTQTILNRNFDFIKTLPSGSVCLASNQIAGRGRGKNSWVSQEGGLQFSLMLRHSVNYVQAPVVFLQYLISLAVVESILARPGYEQVPLFLKWPNDIYAKTTTMADGNNSKDDTPLKKIGGLLVNSHYMDNEFTVVVGCGLNLSNTFPTTSINQVIKAYDSSLPALSSEDVLANILVSFESLYAQFCEHGIGAWFLSRYYKHWLHSEQLVTLKTHDNAVARIEGITTDCGSLVAVDIDSKIRYELQPDGNSFDMMKGLVVIKE
ncbi:biotin-protein ligase [Absidia repens]|uniref:Biotin-protein ligase n=1 Tax=Absidia repens TaxID=90262 RepID=A0A1X2IY04_9FUNG|nr:biotin-protein ligase [Absidia repens]